MTHVSLFTGIGGLDLAAEAAGFETVLQVDREPYALKILERHWPDVKRMTDVRDVTRSSIDGPVTVVSGGFPCQPFSAAGQRRGTDDDRYLWPELLRIVEELQPCWVVGENVSGLLSINDGMEIDNMLASLEARNYTPWILHHPAAGVGAHHKRDRVFIIGAYNDTDTDSSRHERWKTPSESNKGAIKKRSEQRNRANTLCLSMADTAQLMRDGSGRTRGRRTEHTNGGEDVADAESEGLQGQLERRQGRRQSGRYQVTSKSISRREETMADAGSARQQERDVAAESERQRHSAWRDDTAGRDGTAESCLGGVAYGLPDWMDGEPAGLPRVTTGIKDRAARLKALGNAVVPAQAYPIFAAIAHAEMSAR